MLTAGKQASACLATDSTAFTTPKGPADRQMRRSSGPASVAWTEAVDADSCDPTAAGSADMHTLELARPVPHQSHMQLGIECHGALLGKRSNALEAPSRSGAHAPAVVDGANVG